MNNLLTGSGRKLNASQAECLLCTLACTLATFCVRRCKSVYKTSLAQN